MTFVPIASSSSGNAYVVEHAGRAVLIDCGVPLKEIEARCGEAGVDTRSIEGVLVTHNHSDHIACLQPFLRRHDVPVYANALTAESVAAALGARESGASVALFEDRAARDQDIRAVLHADRCRLRVDAGEVDMEMMTSL